MGKILGISAFYHDSAATLTINGRVIAAAQEERFTRVKGTSVFPKYAIGYCLGEAGIRIDDLDAIVYYDKPYLKFERILESYYTYSPRGIKSFLKSMPLWLKEKLFIKKMIYVGLSEIDSYNKKRIKLLFTEHHLSHAASAFYPSPYDMAAILTIDGVGEWCTASISIGEGRKIRILKQMEFPHSVGLLYSSFTYYLGFIVNSGEYKIMGLAPYGNINSMETQEFIKTIKTVLIDIKEDGSVWLNQKYFNYATGLRMVIDRKWEKLFGFKRRSFEAEIEQKHCNLALAIQLITEEIVIKMANEAKRLTKADYLCMAGGVALNCVANGELLRRNLFKGIYIQPAPGDAGGSLGAALAVEHMYYGSRRINDSKNDLMAGAFLGPDYSEREIQQMNQSVNSAYNKFDDFSALVEFIARKLANGKIVGWFQGRMEFGPRALGNRSILADARDPDMMKKLNMNIKYREGFRPFASSVLIDDVSDYFDLQEASPYMNFVASVKSSKDILPDNFESFTLLEKMYIRRGIIPSVTHLDNSSRIQTVEKDTNLRYWQLISAFKIFTGCGLLINTSFNVRGEPIVCTPFDAYRCFMSTEMDYLVIGDFVYCKKDQFDWRNKEKWRKKYEKD